MARRKQAKRITMKDIRSILRLTFEQGLSVREVSERLRIGKTAVSTYLLRAREAGLCTWPIPIIYDDDIQLEKLLFKRTGRPARGTQVLDFAYVARELKRKGVTLTLLWKEYRTAHPNGYMHQELFAGVTATVSSQAAAAVGNAYDAAKKVGDGNTANSIVMATIAGVNGKYAYDALTNGQKWNDGFQQSGPLLQPSIGIGFQYQKNSAEGSSSTRFQRQFARAIR